MDKEKSQMYVRIAYIELAKVSQWGIFFFFLFLKDKMSENISEFVVSKWARIYSQ